MCPILAELYSNIFLNHEANHVHGSIRVQNIGEYTCPNLM